MLVLSRKEDDSIRFPELDITIEILKVKGSSVRVGIDAPIEINVLRGELEESGEVARSVVISGADEHEIRNKLNSLNIAAAMAKRLIARGQFETAANRLSEVLHSISDSDCPETSRRPVTALLVEDTANEREMLAGFLQLHGFDVVSVGDGMEALQYLESNEKPDLILMDMRLPKLNGADAIRQIRSNPAFDPVKIFAVSGNTPEEVGLDASRNRVARWFQKPLEPARLVNEINQLVAPLPDQAHPMPL